MKSLKKYANQQGFQDTGPVSNDPALVQFIRNELLRVPGPTNENSKYLNIVCPFHPDARKPHLGVRIGDPTAKTPLGSVTCFVCGEKGRWQKLADKLGLRKLPKHVTINHLNVDRKTVTRLLGKTTYTMDSLVQSIGGVQVYRSWPHYQEWRSFDGKFIAEMGGQELTYQGKRGLVYRHMLLPVHIEGELIGGIRCKLKSIKGSPSYLNTAGEWSSDQGLFPYDHIATMGKRWVMLVEGPRDALRLIRDGIPAMCVLGSGMFNRKKAVLVAGLNLDCVFLMGDGDDAGRKFNELAYEHLNELLPTKVIQLPMNGMDPFKMPPELLKKVKALIVRALKEVRSQD